MSSSVLFQNPVHTLALGLGQQAAPSIMLNERASWMLTDDTAARLAAQSLGDEVQGTLGILLRSIRRHQRSMGQIERLLQQLPQKSTLHVPIFTDPRKSAFILVPFDQQCRHRAAFLCRRDGVLKGSLREPNLVYTRGHDDNSGDRSDRH